MLLFIFTYKSIKSVRSGPKSKSIILHDWCDLLGLYFASSRMWRFSTYFEEGNMWESVGINSRQDSLDQVEPQMDLNAIYDFEFRTWNLVFQLSQNRSKLTIQLYDDLTRPYKYLSNSLYKTICIQDNLHVSVTSMQIYTQNNSTIQIPVVLPIFWSYDMEEFSYPFIMHTW